VYILKEKLIMQRLAVYVCGLFILSMGVAFSINADLGVSPVSTFPYVLSHLTAFSVGTLTTAMMAIFILLQIAILRKDFKWLNLTQLVFSFIFGYFVDFSRWIVGDFTFPTYFGSLGMLIISIIFITTGVVMFIGAKIVPLPTEGFCLAVEQKMENGKFHIIKMIMDCSLVALGLSFALIFGDELHGIREGTIISAIAIGKTIPYVRKALNPILRRF